MKKIIYFLVVSTMILSSCKKDVIADPNPTYNGVEQSLGNGKVFSYMKFTGDKPTSIGITFSKGAFENIPHGTPTSLIIQLPTEGVGKTPFTHVYLDFNHNGHEPVGVYNVAHFDAHFMTQSNAERSVIPPYSTETAAKFDNLPPAGVMPVPYIRLPAGVPLMGTHWANPTSTELNGGKFTETLIMGSYDGKMTFIEPMVTLEMLLNHPTVSKDVPIPAKFLQAGYYPKKYNITHTDDGSCTISLDELTMMQ
jgi:hypothetical protein